MKVGSIMWWRVAPEDGEPTDLPYLVVEELADGYVMFSFVDGLPFTLPDQFVTNLFANELVYVDGWPK